MGRGFQPTRLEVTAKNHYPWGEDEDRTTRWTLPFWLGEGEQFLRSEEGGSRPPALPLEMHRLRRGPTAGVRAHIPWQGRGGDQEPPIFQGIDEVDRRHEQVDERQRVRQRIQGWAGEVDSVNPVCDGAVEQRPRNCARAPQ